MSRCRQTDLAAEAPEQLSAKLGKADGRMRLSRRLTVTAADTPYRELQATEGKDE